MKQAKLGLVDLAYESGRGEGVTLPTIGRVLDGDFLLKFQVFHEDGTFDPRPPDGLGVFENDLMGGEIG